MTTDEEKLVTDNMNLAYDISWKYYNKFGTKIPVDELQSLAFLGLTKAASTYNKALDFAFSSYAYRCISNEILQYNRQYNKHKDVLSLSQKLTEDIELQDTIALENDLFDDFTKGSAIEKLYEEIDKLNDRHRKIMNYRLKGLTMEAIGQKLGLTQPQISRDYNIALNILRNKFKNWRY